MTRKTVGWAAIFALLAVSAVRGDSVLTGQVAITAGSALERNDVTAFFNISAPGFSASSGTPDWTFQSIPTVPPPSTPLSVSGLVPTAATVGFGCIPGYSSGSYQGILAPCLGGFAGGGSLPEGISFVGTLTSITGNSQNGYTALGGFTASGEVQGYGPPDCPSSATGPCSELFDVTFTGQGTMQLSSAGSQPFFSDLELTFEPTPEPATMWLFGGGLLMIAALGLGKMHNRPS